MQWIWVSDSGVPHRQRLSVREAIGLIGVRGENLLATKTSTHKNLLGPTLHCPSQKGKVKKEKQNGKMETRGEEGKEKRKKKRGRREKRKGGKGLVEISFLSSSSPSRIHVVYGRGR